MEYVGYSTSEESEVVRILFTFLDEEWYPSIPHPRLKVELAKFIERRLEKGSVIGDDSHTIEVVFCSDPHVIIQK